jgi:hypothetical protein
MIDGKRLPVTAMVDTMVLRLALDTTSTDVRAVPSQQFLDAMEGAGRPVFVAAPSIAEILQWAGHQGPPLTELVQTLAFDLTAANLLGERLPADLLKEARHPRGGSRLVYKYDAMILACAMRWGMETLLTYDGYLQNLCERVGQDWKTPEHFQLAPQAPAAQGTLFSLPAIAPLAIVPPPSTGNQSHPPSVAAAAPKKK